MAAYLYGPTALEYWFKERSLSINPHHTLYETLQHTLEEDYDRTRVRTLRKTALSDEDCKLLLSRELETLTRPLHLLVAHDVDRRSSKLKICHVWGGPVPRGAFYHLHDDVYVSSPAFCYLQLAAPLSLVDLIQLGDEICGAYVPSCFDALGIRLCPPLTTVEELRSFAQRASAMNGSNKAMRAGSHVVYGSASPMETAQQMLLCLPERLGGHGLDGSHVNYRIDMRSAVQFETDSAYRLCDLYWPEHKLAIEYDGVRSHTGHHREERDIERRNKLATTGVTVITVTHDQLNDFDRTHLVAEQIARHIGVRKQPKRRKYNWTARALELRRTVLPPNPLAFERVLGLTRGEWAQNH